MTHSPGPWLVGRSPDFDAFEFDVKAGDYYVAAIPEVPGRTEANAHLIAAAPELLNLAKDLFAEAGLTLDTCDERCTSENCIRVRAGAVFAKAEARS